MSRHGENIHKRKDRRWEARLLITDQISGKKKYQYYYGDSYQEAKEKREAAVYAMKQEEIAVHSEYRNLTFEELSQHWLESKKPKVKESTYALYRYDLHQYLLPKLGKKRLYLINTDDVLSALADIEKTRGLSKKTMTDIRGILHMIIKYAQEKGSLTRIVWLNPSGAYRPKRIQVLTPSEQQKINRYMKDHPARINIAIYLSLYCGLRIGEVCALRWEDFNLIDGFFMVDKTLERIYSTEPEGKSKTKVVIQSAKTYASERILPISDALMDMLGRYQSQAAQIHAAQKESKPIINCEPANYYVLSGKEKYMEPRTLSRHYKRFLENAGVTDHTYHTLRHTFATRCMEQQADVKLLSEIMGHANVTITMQRYVHPSFESKRTLLNNIYIEET